MVSLEHSTILAHFGYRRTDRPKPASAKQLCTRFLAKSPTAATDENHTRVNGDTDTWNGNN
jgi:hypothetical protein